MCVRFFCTIFLFLVIYMVCVYAWYRVIFGYFFCCIRMRVRSPDKKWVSINSQIHLYKTSTIEWGGGVVHMPKSRPNLLCGSRNCMKPRKATKNHSFFGTRRPEKTKFYKNLSSDSNIPDIRQTVSHPRAFRCPVSGISPTKPTSGGAPTGSDPREGSHSRKISFLTHRNV